MSLQWAREVVQIPFREDHRLHLRRHRRCDWQEAEAGLVHPTHAHHAQAGGHGSFWEAQSGDYPRSKGRLQILFDPFVVL